MMISSKSESDLTISTRSAPARSSKSPVYYVQSPSRDSHDGDKSSSMQNTPMSHSPMESPSHPSFGHHSRNSSYSWFSGIFRSSSGRKWGRKRNDKGWPECSMILKEGSYDEFEEKAFIWSFQAVIALCSFVILFAIFCLIIWGASRSYKAEVVVKSFTVNNFYTGEGSDSSGIPTKMVTLNGTLRLNVYNPATLFGIHVTSSPVDLAFSEITVATGQLKKYYQPRKSHRIVLVNVEGNKVPLYGAGSGLSDWPNGGPVPFTMRFEIHSRGDVVGKLGRVRHHKHITCPVAVDSMGTKRIVFKKDTCTYEWRPLVLFDLFV